MRKLLQLKPAEVGRVCARPGVGLWARGSYGNENLNLRYTAPELNGSPKALIHQNFTLSTLKPVSSGGSGLDRQ